MVMEKNLEDIINHPDREEIISKLILGSSPKDISNSLKAKYKAVHEKRFVITEKVISIFQDKYLDLYQHLKEEILVYKNTGNISIDKEIDKTVKNNKTYKQRMDEMLNQEIDIKTTAKKLLIAIEARAEQVFDHIQANPNEFKQDRILIEYFNALSAALEKVNKVVNEAPDQIIQHNFNIQLLDQHVIIIQDAIKDVLSKLDYETSIYFMDLVTEKLKKLKEPDNYDSSTEERYAQVKMLTENIVKK